MATLQELGRHFAARWLPGGSHKWIAFARRAPHPNISTSKSPDMNNMKTQHHPFALTRLPFTFVLLTMLLCLAAGQLLGATSIIYSNNFESYTSVATNLGSLVDARLWAGRDAVAVALVQQPSRAGDRGFRRHDERSGGGGGVAG